MNLPTMKLGKRKRVLVATVGSLLCLAFGCVSARANDKMFPPMYAAKAAVDFEGKGFSDRRQAHIHRVSRNGVCTGTACVVARPADADQARRDEHS